MRRACVSLLTAATVLWHAVVGCCAHHEHATHEHEHDAVHAAAEVHDEAEDGDHHDEAPCSEPAAPCEEGACSFLAAKLTSSAERVGEQLLAANVPEVRSVAVADVRLTDDYATETAVRPPPLRTHLALGILLI